MKGYGPFIATHPEIPWQDIRCMRNHITHVYFGIDLEIVWDTATRWNPDLLARLPAVRAAACEELHVDR